jgi:hypothetical protein
MITWGLLMSVGLAATRIVANVALAVASLVVAACAVSTQSELNRGLGCVDDSPECIGHRQTSLRYLVDDKSKSWINDAPTPEAYASGVRLFAYKAKKKELTCDELQRGKLEADTAKTSLASVGNRLTPAQVARSNMLAGEVGRELQSELNRRCRKS